MRQVKEHVVGGVKRYRVRYRQGGVETSKTFRARTDADTFAALLGTGKADNIAEALGWMAQRESQQATATFAEWFASYLQQLTGITERTRADYEAMHRRYLTNLDSLPITLVTRAHVAAIVNQLDRQGLSPKTIKNVVHLLASVFSLAVDDGLIARSPVRRVRLPKASIDNAEPRFLTTHEAALLVACTPEHYQPLVTFLLGTGVRWSEATALTGRHINLDAGTVTVRQAWKRIPGGWEVGAPKTEKAKRTVNAAVPALLAVAPLIRKPGDWIFTTPGGSVVRHANFYNRIWVPSCERAGLDPRPRIHDTRHTHASWLLSAGIALEAVQDQLGHESFETTRRVYAHLLPAVGVAVGKAASETMDELLRQRAQLAPRPLLALDQA